MGTDRLGASGIPPDLEERAVETLGRQFTSIEAFVQTVSEIRWLSRVHQPEPWDPEVYRLRSFEQAVEVEKAFRSVSEAVWKAVEMLGRTASRFEQMQAAENYWIVRHNVPEESLAMYDRLSSVLSADQVGMMRELILEDIVPVGFYRRQLEWYERGHWLCAVDLETGRPVVY